MQNAYYAYLQHVTDNSLLYISFVIACPSVSETIGFLDDPGSSIMNRYQSLALGVTL